MQEMAIRNQILSYEQEIANARAEFERALDSPEIKMGGAVLKNETKEKFERKITELNEQIRQLEKQLFEVRIDSRISDSVRNPSVFPDYSASRNWGSSWSESDF